jgi:shikimate kinase
MKPRLFGFQILLGLKVLVIGVAGTGKSYLVKKMKRLNLNAVDVDHGLATFVDENGNEVEYNPNGGAKWWKSHYYVLKPRRLEALLDRSKALYLFGDVGGQTGWKNGLLDDAHLFDRVYYLHAPLGLIKQRLAKRTDNPFGKNPEEIEGVAKHKAKLDRIAKTRNLMVIDATLPTEKIIEILTRHEREEVSHEGD